MSGHLNQLIGKIVTVILLDGHTFASKLVDVDNNLLIFERRDGSIVVNSRESIRTMWES